MEDQELIARVRKHFNRAQSKFAPIHKTMRADMAMASGVTDAQWGDEDSRIRGKNRAKFSFPMLDKFVERTVGLYNVAPYGIGYEATSSQGAGVAKLFDGLAGGVEASSQAKAVYRTALRHSLSGGYGWIYLTTEYLDQYDESDSVGICIKTSHDPTAFMLDPISREVDGRDAQWAIHRDGMDLEQAKEEYGDDVLQYTGIGFLDSAISKFFNSNDTVPVITHWECENTYSEIAFGADGKPAKKGDKTKRVKSTQIRVTKIVGNKVVQNVLLPMRCLPVVPVYGLPVYKDGEILYRAFIHGGRDAQRLINYVTSWGAERVARSPQAPFMASSRAIAPHLAAWSNAPRDNPTVLLFEDMSKDGKPISAPIPLSTTVDLSDVIQAQQSYNSLLELVLGMPSQGFGSDGNVQQTAEEVLTRTKAGESVLSTVFENMKASIERVGEVLAEMLLMTVDTPRTMSVVENGQMIRSEVPDLSSLGVSLSDLKVRATSGPLLATQRKESLRSYLALGSLLGEDAWVVMPKIAENIDDNDEELAEQLKVIGQQRMQGAAQAQAQLQAQQNEISQLKAYLQESNETVLSLRRQSTDKRLEIIADMAKQEDQQSHEIDMALIKQKGQTALDANKIALEADADAAKDERELLRLLAKREQMNVGPTVLPLNDGLSGRLPDAHRSVTMDGLEAANG